MRKSTIIINIVCLGVGAAAGYIFADRKLNKHYADISDEEIKSVKDMYNAKIKQIMDLEKKMEEFNNQHDEVNINADEIDTTRSVNPTKPRKLVSNSYERAKTAYNLIAMKKQNEEEPTNDEDTEEDDGGDVNGISEEDSIKAGEASDKEPYTIEADEFEEKTLGYDKVELYYYRVDDVLCNGDDQIEDADETIGYDAMCQLDVQTTIWVRNEKLKIDYQVIAVAGAYSDTVNNSSPREQYEKKKRAHNEE